MRHSLTQGHYIGILYAINMHLYRQFFFFWGGLEQFFWGLEPPPPPKPHTRTAPANLSANDVPGL